MAGSSAMRALTEGTGSRGRRAADADREWAVARLRAAVAEERLTLDEYDDRVRQAYAAHHLADLHALLVDLPEPEPPATV
jgi:hypothetical protein